MAFSFRSLNFTGGFADQNLPIVFTLNFVKIWQLLRNNYFLFCLIYFKIGTLIFLINVKSRLTILKNSTIYKKKSTPHVYWFLRLFPSSNPPLLELCTSIFQKIPPSMFIPTSTFIREMRVLVWTIQPTGLNTCMHLYCCNFKQTWTRTHFFSNLYCFKFSYYFILY